MLDTTVGRLSDSTGRHTSALATARRLLPALGVVVVLVVVSVGSDTPATSLVRYALCCVWMVVLPGVLVRRLVLGAARDRVDEIAIGSAIGLVLLTAVWAIMTALGINAVVAVWPALLAVPLLLLPRTRATLQATAPTGRVSEAAGWLLALAATAALVVWGVGFAATTQLPPGPFAWYQDDYWHLSLAAELGRRVPPDTSQVAGHPFMYHWFANANIWTMSKASGLDLVLVYARLWEPPLRILAVGLAFVLGRRLTGSAVAGSIVGVLLVAGTELRASWFSLPGHLVLNLHSPSQLFGVITLLLVLVLLVDLLAGKGGPARAVLLVASSLSTVGAKASIPPVVLTGGGLVWLRTLAGRRLGGIDTTLKRATAAFVLGLGTVVAGLLFAAGGSAGVTVQLLAGVRITPPWEVFTGHVEDLTGALLMPGLRTHTGVLLTLLVLLHYGVSFGWLATAWPLLRRGAAAAWLLLGVGIGGFLAMMLLDQDGSSQVYFMMGALVAWQALAVWGLHDSVTTARTRFSPVHVVRAATVGAAAGVALSTVLRMTAGSAPSASGVAGSLVRSLVLVAVLVLMIGVAARVLRGRVAVGVACGMLVIVASVWWQLLGALRLNPPDSLTLLGCVVLAACALLPVQAVRPLFAAGLAVTVVHAALTMAPLVKTKQISAGTRVAVTAQEYEAARWLAANTPADDIVATNVHCTGTRTFPHCDVRAFWVTAFGERRAVLESWAYTSQAHAMQGVGGFRSTRQPYYDQAFYTANEQAFSAPTQARLAWLKARGARWLVADTRAGAVSPRLADLAEPVHTSGTVTIYRLR